jgi:putative phage-type endonuclease
MSLTIEQQIARREGLGASDAAPAIGKSPWVTRYKLYLEKIGDAPPEDPDDVPVHLEIGNVLEPVNLRRFTRKTGLIVTDRQRKFVDPKWARRWVAVDGMASDGGYIEAKSTGFIDPSEWGPELNDDAVPAHYLIQTQHGLGCSGLSHCWMPLITTTRQFRVYRIRRDQELIDLIFDAEQKFWRHVEQRDPPPIMTLDDVSLRWPSDIPEKRSVATLEFMEDLQTFVDLKDEAKALDLNVEHYKLHVAKFIADASEIVDGDGQLVCTYRQAKPSMKFDEDRFERENPLLYAKYLKEVPGSRRLLPKIKPTPARVPEKAE